MKKYARILNGEVIERKGFEGTPPLLSPNKGAWVVINSDDRSEVEYDPAKQRLRPVTKVYSRSIHDTYEIVDMTEDEIWGELRGKAEQEIRRLERQVTLRWMRNAAIGDEYAQERIKEIESEMALHRVIIAKVKAFFAAKYPAPVGDASDAEAIV